MISADSHPVSGGVVFSVGTPGTAPRRPCRPAERVERGPGDRDRVRRRAGRRLPRDRAAARRPRVPLLSWRPALVSAAGAGGGWPEASTAFAARARRMLAVAVVLGVVSGAAGIVLQGATAGGTSFWSALDPSVVREVLGTRFGRIWGLRVLDWLLLGGVLAAGAGARTIPVLRPAAVGRRRRRPRAVPRRGRPGGAGDPRRVPRDHAGPCRARHDPEPGRRPVPARRRPRASR